MQTPFIGSIQYYAFNFAPRGWTNCNGQLLAIATNQALFALFGTYYGGDGRTTFGLPDMRGRSIQGWSNNNAIGERTGSESAAMLIANMPLHTHTATVKIAAYVDTRDGGSTNDPTNNYMSTPANGSGNLFAATPTPNAFLGAPSVVVGQAGSSVPFNTLNPYLALTCCVALTGLFPSRN
jgi:microcystin-dependent protein